MWWQNLITNFAFFHVDPLLRWNTFWSFKLFRNRMRGVIEGKDNRWRLEERFSPVCSALPPSPLVQLTLYCKMVDLCDKWKDNGWKWEGRLSIGGARSPAYYKRSPWDAIHISPPLLFQRSSTQVWILDMHFFCFGWVEHDKDIQIYMYKHTQIYTNTNICKYMCKYIQM